MTHSRIAGTTLVLIALSVAACGSAPGGGQANSSPAASAAPAAQSGTNGPCANIYVPVVNGASWTYAVTDNINGPSTSSATITAVAADSFTLAVKNPKVSWTETWSCTKDGLLQLQNGGGALGATFSGPDGKATVTVTSNAGLTLPLTIKPGDSWSQTTAYSLTSTVGVSGTSKTNYTYKAVALESVTVPAGTFDAMRIDVTTASAFTFSDGKVLPSTSSGSVWLVKGKGQVKVTQADNLGGSNVNLEEDLQSLQVP